MDALQVSACEQSVYIPIMELWVIVTQIKWAMWLTLE